MPAPTSRLTFAGDINSFTGYGKHAIQIVRDLSRLTGAHVSVRPLSHSEAFGSRIPIDIVSQFVNCIQPEPWELLLHPPNFAPTPGKNTAYFSMWETTKLPPMAVQFLNQAKVVIVPSQWNASCFSACGVTAPIRVAQLGIDPEVFYYRSKSPSPKCIFGAAGRLAHGGIRKGVNDVIDLFQRAFPKEQDVELWVKAFPDCDIKSVTNDPRIKVTQAYLTDPVLADWFAGLDCFVSAARGEGWGLMQHQAMAVGRPVISTLFGGLTEYFNVNVGYVAEHVLEPARFAYEGCGHWAVPVDQSMIGLMQRVYYQRFESMEKGAKASIALQHLTWDNANRQLVTILKEFGAL